ncbi:winged helix-turn-helix transcriptional regulator [Humibacter albus]|uniref:winged helix-turn-helix transcriptional regulator n=1 Tax=Humibacter albus TaxID=427754 RepID=UPI0003B44BB3|nr:response regulator transcription factor [Humibacter albus]
MAHILVLTPTPSAEVLPALSLLAHQVHQIPSDASALAHAPACDVVVVDARHDLAGARSLCRLLTSAGDATPVILALTEGGLAAVNGEWGVADVILAGAGPAETDARLRLVLDRTSHDSGQTKIQASGVTIDEASYSAKVHGRALDLTFKEFELLKFFATNPARVFTREQLLSEVWGYDYFGGTRTVDVHVRRLRAKLGESESLIGTVRNVGYRFNVLEDEDGEE